ncbi:MAG: acyl-CoA thioesterase [Oceanospirillaceae bacterium]|nr:acyl-CoA thioesterase [Oceanospirillaceae bacterium]
MSLLPSSIPALRTIAMPADANPDGDIFGGWIMSQMDIASGNFAAHQVKGRVVTVAVDAMTFLKPIYIGDDVSCYCDIANIGNTSLSINVNVWVQRHHSEEVLKVTQGRFTFVAIDGAGSPRKIVKLKKEIGSE